MYLIDSDFWVNYFVDSQPFNLTTKQFLYTNPASLTMLQIAMFETATVLSYKFGHQIAKNAVRDIGVMNVKILTLNDPDVKEIWNIFNGQTKKGTSFVDCANLYAAEKFKLKICSFDTFYPKKYILSVLK